MRNYRTQALLVSTALALASVTVAAPAAAQQQAYNIPAMPLAESLREFGKTSGKQIIFSDKLVRGKTGARVQGSVTPDQALATMLAGSGLEAKQSAAGAYLIVATTGPALGESPAGNVAADKRNVDNTGNSGASRVVDARTGAALKGALVEIVETGEKTSTGDLGEFRFPGKNGSFNLRISYLGYPEYQQLVDLSDGRATSGILLSDDSATGEIIVTAHQSARAQALNQERTAENTSTVVSADLLGQFDGTTISDALRRVPGVAFIADNASADGTNIIIRGMEPGFNTITLNGVRLPVGTGVSRSPSLNNILADSVSKITINKTLLPSQDGSGTGGLVDIETKGPLDRPNFYASFSSEKALAAKSFLDESFVSGTISAKFGSSRNFGLSLSGQYRDRDIDRISITSTPLLGQYLPLGISTASQISPEQTFPYEPGVDRIMRSQASYSQSTSRIKNLTVVASAQWQPSDSTHLRLDYTYSDARASGHTQLTSISATSGYRSMPIQELGGETRFAYIWENASQPGLLVRTTKSATLTPEDFNKSSTLRFTGKTHLGPWTFDYTAGYAIGKTHTPSPFGVSLNMSTPLNLTRAELTDEVLNNSRNGRLVSLFPTNDGSTIPYAGLNEAGMNRINNLSNYNASIFGGVPLSGSNSRWTGAVDAKREFSAGLLKYIQAGVFFERSKNSNDFLDFPQYFTNLTVSQLGISDGASALGRVNLPTGISVIDLASVRDLRRAIASGSIAGVDVVSAPADALSFDDYTIEDDLAGFLQAFVQIGKLEIIGGIRVERVRTDANVMTASVITNEDGSFDEDYFLQTARITSLIGSEVNFLPRVMANLRLNDNFIIRAGYYLSIARPNINQLNSALSFDLNLQPINGPNGDQPLLSISSGNPNLKAAYTHNLDLSVEWYSDDIGAIKAGIFYKPTKNAIFTNAGQVNNGTGGIELPDDPRFSTPNLFTQILRPENDAALAELWGAEFSIERKFTFLPSPFDRFGIFANYTFTDSSRQAKVFYAPAPDSFVFFDVPYASSPKHSGTVALTYSSKGVDATVSYTRQSGYITNFQGLANTSYRSGVSSLDAKIQYAFPISGTEVRLYVEGSNLLQGAKDPYLRNELSGIDRTYRAFNSVNYYGGRSVRFGAQISF